MDGRDPNQRRIQQAARKRAKEKGIKYTTALREIQKEIQEEKRI